MFTILYRYRNPAALVVAVGAGAVLLLPATEGIFGKVTTAAATPDGDGTQNPFIDRRPACRDCPKR